MPRSVRREYRRLLPFVFAVPIPSRLPLSFSKRCAYRGKACGAGRVAEGINKKPTGSAHQSANSAVARAVWKNRSRS